MMYSGLKLYYREVKSHFYPRAGSGVCGTPCAPAPPQPPPTPRRPPTPATPSATLCPLAFRGSHATFPPLPLCERKANGQRRGAGPQGGSGAGVQLRTVGRTISRFEAASWSSKAGGTRGRRLALTGAPARSPSLRAAAPGNRQGRVSRGLCSRKKRRYKLPRRSHGDHDAAAGTKRTQRDTPRCCSAARRLQEPRHPWRATAAARGDEAQGRPCVPFHPPHALPPTAATELSPSGI